jgi:hypothetical protein
MTLSAAAARTIAVEFAAASPGARELRQFPFRRLSFGTRKRRANQPPMHRSVVFGPPLLSFVSFVLDSDWNFLRMLNRFFCDRRLLYRYLFCQCLGRRGFFRDVFGR